jgi:hypothetical protein
MLTALTQPKAESMANHPRPGGGRRFQPNHVSRRQFLRSTAGLGALAACAPLIIPSTAFAAPGVPGPNERFVIGLIGTGGMGMTHLANLLRFEAEGKLRIAAVCDCDENRLEAAWKNTRQQATPYLDYRHILERNDIDCVVIATPDHWHAVQTVHACETGKHVFVEKPASVTVREGQAMVDAARSNRVAVQVGAQARTAVGAWQTCRAIRNGIVGRVQQVTCWHYASPADDNPVPDSEPPEGLDWGASGSAHSPGGLTTADTSRARSAGSWSLAAARFAIEARINSAPSYGR